MLRYLKLVQEVWYHFIGDNGQHHTNKICITTMGLSMTRGDIIPLLRTGIVIKRTKFEVFTIHNTYFGTEVIIWTNDDSERFTRVVNSDGEEYER